MRKCAVYSESVRLKEILDNLGWSLYDVTMPKGQRKEFAEMEREGSAKQFFIGRNYMFAPHQIPGKSLRETYAITKGLGPSLQINDPNEDRWRSLALYSGRYQNRKPILFTRLDFQSKFLGAFTPITTLMPNPDIIGIDYRFAIGTFEKYFRIVTPEEEGCVIIPNIPPRELTAN